MTNAGGVLLVGKTLTVLSESMPSAGSQSRVFTIDCDTFQTSLFVSSISGALNITVYTLTQEGREKEVISYTGITAPSTELSLKKAAAAMGVVRVVAIYTGPCTFELRAKGLSSGETSATIQSANTAKASQVTVSSTPTILLPAALTDRKGVIIRHNGNTGNTLYLGFSQAQASTETGYPLGKGEALALDVATGAVLWAVSGTSIIDVRIIEAGG
jgi:hypothetical protein